MESRRRALAVVALALVLGLLPGCAGSGSSEGDGAGQSTGGGTTTRRVLEPGVVVYESTAERAGATVQVWLYVPEGATGGLPAVLIGPAGSPQIHGMALAEGDRAEHLPWVEAGYVVIAYDIEGSVGDGASDEELVSAVERFRDADYGVADASLALDVALARPGLVDPTRVVTVGHSSAAGLAILVAARDERVAACVAFAPAADISERLGAEWMAYLSDAVPDFDTFVRDASARSVVDTITRPVFLFHADDDQNVPADSFDSFDSFAGALSSANGQVSVHTVSTGGHYDSMVEQGIPLAIAWTDELFGMERPSGE